MAKAETVEIERKFLVTGDAWRQGAKGLEICQGYLSRTPRGVVRIRTYGERAFLAVKGSRAGLLPGAHEYEYEVPREHAVDMLALCEGALIEKTRYRIRHADHTWDVDVFAGANAGLIVAEIELEAEDEPFEKPPWVGEEVSEDERYRNSHLSLHPYDEATWER